MFCKRALMGLMVVNDFHVVGFSVFPSEADAPLAIDSDAVFPFAVSAERLQSIPRRESKIVQTFSSLKKQQLP